MLKYHSSLKPWTGACSPMLWNCTGVSTPCKYPELYSSFSPKERAFPSLLYSVCFCTSPLLQELLATSQLHLPPNRPKLLVSWSSLGSTPPYPTQVQRNMSVLWKLNQNPVYQQLSLPRDEHSSLLLAQNNWLLCLQHTMVPKLLICYNQLWKPKEENVDLTTHSFVLNDQYHLDCQNSNLEI